MEAARKVGTSSVGRLAGRAAGSDPGVAAPWGCGWQATTASWSKAAPAAATWLAAATRACSAMPCRCTEEVVATLATCSAVATRAD